MPTHQVQAKRLRPDEVLVVEEVHYVGVICGWALTFPEAQSKYA